MKNPRYVKAAFSILGRDFGREFGPGQVVDLTEKLGGTLLEVLIRPTCLHPVGWAPPVPVVKTEKRKGERLTR